MIIQSLLDTDLYKFTMMQVVLHQFPGAQVEYKFKCRTAGVDLAQFTAEIQSEIDALCTLRMSREELAYLRSLRFIKSDFVDFLDLFHLQTHYVTLTPQADGTLDISVTGPWLHTILFEIPILAIVNEVYFRNTHGRLELADLVHDLAPDSVKNPQTIALRGEGFARLKHKVALIKNDANLES